MWKYRLWHVGNVLAGTYVPEGAWIDRGVFYSAGVPPLTQDGFLEGNPLKGFGRNQAIYRVTDLVRIA